MAERYLIHDLSEVTGVEGTFTEAQKFERTLNETRSQEKAAAVAAKEKENVAKQEMLIERTRKHEAEYLANIAAIEKMRKTAESDGGFYKEDEPQLLFAIRIKGINKVAPRPRKILQLFRLLQLNNGVFIKVNKATLNMLKHIEPYIAYGYPNLETVRELIYKRGCARIGQMGSRQRIPIHDNSMVSDNLGKFGIHGVEDIVHEIYTVGPHFTQCNNFLWTFKLNSPKGGFICKRHGYTEIRGGDHGNREEFINQLVAQMN